MTSHRATRRKQLLLFWAQIMVGGFGMFGTVLMVQTLTTTGFWFTGAFVWLGATIAALWAMERAKGLNPKGDDGVTDWARHVRELRSSRLEIVEAFEIERGRIERDLHDGAQQHIVAAAMKVGEARLVLGDVPEVDGLLAEAQDASDAALAALRATVAGIHPRILTDRGLEAAVRDLAHRSPANVAVQVPHPLPRLPEGVAAAAYFLVSEALTNVAKHAPQAQVSVLLSADERLHVAVVDDGPGGAKAERGRGLGGMTERLAAFGGTLEIASPAGGPTTLQARIPLLLSDGQPGVAVEGRKETL